jgi:hypothetical protein
MRRSTVQSFIDQCDPDVRATFQQTSAVNANIW